MRDNLGASASLAAAFRLGPLRSKLIEINLVMGIVKIALIVLALVASACPLPFESVATPQFMAFWYAAVTVLYLVASDFFHVARLVAYLELWKSCGQAARQLIPAEVFHPHPYAFRSCVFASWSSRRIISNRPSALLAWRAI